MSFCFCHGTVSHPKPRPCSDCLVANTVLVGCGQGLLPCGGSTSINLDEYNRNGAGAVYELQPGGYDVNEFASVTLSSAGVLSVVTGPAYTPHQIHSIDYTVTKGRYKDFGTISFCLDNPCNAGCSGVCNTCSGDCYGSGTGPSVVAANCGDIGNSYNAAAGLNLSACDGVTTWSVEAVQGIAAVINSSGLITYDVLNNVIPEQKYRVTWTANCSLYGMSATGWFDVEIQNLCVGVSCDGDQVCVPCTGECVDIESDMSAQGTGVGAGAGGGLGLS